MRPQILILFLSLVLSFMTSAMCAQTAEQIKAKKQRIEQLKLDTRYYYGEGVGEKPRDAKELALSNLISSICVYVSQSSSLDMENTIRNGDVQTTEQFRSRMGTYSSMALNDCQSDTWKEKDVCYYFLYIERSKIQEMFENRKRKVAEYGRIANKAMEDVNIADALRYYYSAYLLSQGIPDIQNVRVEDLNGREQMAGVWLRKTIEDILSNISVSVVSQEGSTCTLKFLYKKQPLSKIDYTYYYGSGWTSRPTKAMDGNGQADLDASFSAKDMDVRVEYKYGAEAGSDKELAAVYEALSDELEFKNEITVHSARTVAPAKQDQKKVATIAKPKKSGNSTLSGDAALPYMTTMEKVITAIRTKSYDSVKSLFTTDGYDVFDKLLKYGNARIIGTPTITFTPYDQWVFARSVPMQFSFHGNNHFSENVVFTFNTEGLIDNITFGLGDVAAQNLYGNLYEDSDAGVRNAISNFLENYKTAYALGRFDYLESVFSDDALIITGKVLKRMVGDKEHGYHMEQTTEKTRQSKRQFLDNLKRAYNMKEFVNLQFVNNTIRRNMVSKAQGKDVFGIQIRQDYFSSNYSDKGYLFLLVDVTDPNQPIIHVRVWEEKPDDNGEIFDLSRFN